jgi:hypothetical protein
VVTNLNTLTDGQIWPSPLKSFFLIPWKECIKIDYSSRFVFNLQFPTRILYEFLDAVRKKNLMSCTFKCIKNFSSWEYNVNLSPVSKYIYHIPTPTMQSGVIVTVYTCIQDYPVSNVGRDTNLHGFPKLLQLNTWIISESMIIFVQTLCNSSFIDQII